MTARVVPMLTGWVSWRSRSGLTIAHYVGAPGCAPLCGWNGPVRDVPAAVQASNRIAAPADSSRCRACVAAGAPRR